MHIEDLITVIFFLLTPPGWSTNVEDIAKPIRCCRSTPTYDVFFIHVVTGNTYPDKNDDCS
jgi:hypothetical protein